MSPRKKKITTEKPEKPVPSKAPEPTKSPDPDRPTKPVYQEDR